MQNTTPFLTVPEVLALVTTDGDPPLDVEAPATSSGDGSEHPSDPASVPQSPNCSNRISNINYIPPSAILPVPKAPARKLDVVENAEKLLYSLTLLKKISSNKDILNVNKKPTESLERRKNV